MNPHSALAPLLGNLQNLVLPILVPLEVLVPVPMSIDTGFLALFTSGGLVAMILTSVSVYRALKSGARADELDDLAQAEHSARSERQARAFTETERDYWHRRDAAVEYELIKAGGAEAIQRVLQVVGEPPEPPPPEPAPKRRKPKSASRIYAELRSGLKDTIRDEPSEEER